MMAISYDFLMAPNRSICIPKYKIGFFSLGCPYFDEGTAYAYDLGCPQCDRSSVRLNVSTDGIASCAVCKSEYNLNNDGISETGSSRPLYRYQTTRNGTYLMAHN